MCDNMDALILSGMGREMALDALEKSAVRAEACGLPLPVSVLKALADRQSRALADTGRMALGPGAACSVVDAFADSPFIRPDEAEETLGELIDSFYYFKSEADDEISDDDLLDMMRAYYDGVCQGSVERMRDTTLSDLRASASAGYGEDPNRDKLW